MSLARSYLFVPGTNQDIMKKAILSEADCIIMDLEDAVALAEKESARETVKESLKRFGKEREIIVRINDLNTPFREKDLIAAVSSGASGIMIPKAESSHDIKLVCDKVREYSSHLSYSIKILPLIETAKGIQFAYSIAEADELVSRIAFGSIDYSLDIDCQLTPGGMELLFARSQIVVASRAAGIEAPIDAVYPHLNNADGLEREARFARQLGFKGKLIIHPRQIETVHSIFSPTEQEINEATAIVQAFEEAEKNGIASISVNNQLVDYPVYKKAKSILIHLNR